MGKQLVTKAVPYAPVLGGLSIGTSLVLDGGVIAFIVAVICVLVQVSAMTISWATKGMIDKGDVEDARWKAWLNLDLDNTPELSSGEALGWARPAVSDWPQSKEATGARLNFLDKAEISEEDVERFEKALDKYSGLVGPAPEVPTDAAKGAKRLVRKAESALLAGSTKDAELLYERARALDYRLPSTVDWKRSKNPLSRGVRSRYGYYDEEY